MAGRLNPTCKVGISLGGERAGRQSRPAEEPGPLTEAGSASTRAMTSSRSIAPFLEQVRGAVGSELLDGQDFRIGQAEHLDRARMTPFSRTRR